jgi:lipoprotein-anchoring transpeptidase ErfK/SrfK
MKADFSAAQQALRQAQEALQRGDRQAARRWAEGAAALAPQWDEPWLVLAALSAPRASVAYLERALQINPQNVRARQGLAWAQARLRQETAPSAAREDTAPLRPRNRPAPPSVSRPVAAEPTPTQPRTAPASKPRRRGLMTCLGSLLLLLIGLTGGLAAFWSGGAVPARAWPGAAAVSPTQVLFYGAPARLLKPTYTPTVTPTFTPTATFTPTFTPTATFTATFTPPPTSTFWPTDTALPYATLIPPVAAGERWIDVDLSAQRLYAYQDNTLIAAFIVSTGTAQHPTVTGHYRIYLKLLYTDMAGPGYYLPDVPYTMYFYKGYAIHGTYWHNNFGVPMSHGCVNMRIDDAAWLYSWAPLGTLVNVHY